MIWATLLFLISSYIHIPPENLAAVLKLIMQEQVASIDALISLDYICPCSLLKKTLYTLFLDPLYFLVLSHSIFSFFFLGSRTSSLWLWLGACPQVYPLSKVSYGGGDPFWVAAAPCHGSAHPPGSARAFRYVRIL